MASAIIFYRTEATKQPQSISSLPDEQKLEFDLPEDLLESVSMLHENNIKDAPVSNPSGVRKVNKQDNGLQGLTLTFRGRFKDQASDITTLQRFARRLQVEGQFHQFGVFGFQASTDPPAGAVSTPFNFDPTDTFGLTIKRFTLSRVGGRPKNFDFEITLTSGGVLEQL